MNRSRVFATLSIISAIASLFSVWLMFDTMQDLCIRPALERLAQGTHLPEGFCAKQLAGIIRPEHILITLVALVSTILYGGLASSEARQSTATLNEQ